MEKYKFDKFKLFPTEFRFKNEKEDKEYFDWYSENFSVQNNRHEIMRYFYERMNVKYCRGIVSKVLAFLFLFLAIIFKSYLLVIPSLFFLVMILYYKEKFQEDVRNYRFSDSILNMDDDDYQKFINKKE